MAEATSSSAVARWLARAAHDPVMSAAARGLAVDLVVAVEGERSVLRLAEPCAPGTAPDPDAPRIVLSASPAAIERILSPEPPPGYHAFGALRRLAPDVAIEADPVVEAQALAALERLFELARPDARETSAAPPYERDEAAIVGRWHPLSTAAGTARIWHLAAGEAGRPPLVFLHTAGADARQFRHQLADAGLQRRHRMIAFDLPWHGGSGGVDERESPDPYRLAEADYLAWCVAAIDALAGAPAILVGCSMGAAMALTVLAERPDRVAGVVALEAPLASPGRRNPLLSDARVAGGRHNPAYVRALLAPVAPRVRRDEACAIYAQARPGIYEGDLAYYSDAYDGARIAPGVAASGRRVALLTGSYDYSAPPDSTAALAATIGGPNVRFRELDGFGHFPMIEDPERFRPHLMEALDWIGGGTER